MPPTLDDRFLSSLEFTLSLAPLQFQEEGLSTQNPVHLEKKTYESNPLCPAPS